MAPTESLVLAARPHLFVGVAAVIGHDDWQDDDDLPDGEVTAMLFVHEAGRKSTWRMCWNHEDDGNFDDEANLRWAGKEGPRARPFSVSKGRGTLVDGAAHWGDSEDYEVR